MTSNPLHEGIRLTKKFYMGLPDGVYLVSAVGGFTPFDRDFAEKVGIASERQAQWNRIRERHIDGGRCDVFANEADFKAWMSQWKQTPEGRWIMIPK